MTVLELVKKYELEDFAKTYKNQYGSSCNLKNLDKLLTMEVKGFRVNFPTWEAEITIIDEGV